MLEDILRGLENCQTILAFKDENLSKEFFNLTNSDKKSDLVLFDKDLENDEVEIAFNIETSYELECVNNILNLLSTDIINMSEVS